MIDVSAINVNELPSVPFKDRTRTPDCPAIYFVLQGGNVVYVGCTQSLNRRWKQHHLTSLIGSKAVIAWIEMVAPNPALERDFILRFRPRFNRHGNGSLQTRLGSVRLSKTELSRLLKAAELESITVSEFIRRAIEEKVVKVSRRHPELQAA